MNAAMQPTLFAQPEPKPIGMTPRPYQVECAAAVHDAWISYQSVLVVQATGTGKTVLFANIAHDLADHGRVMVLAHREELIFQAADKIYRVTGHRPGIEMASNWTDMYGLERRFVVSSVQTQNAGMKGNGRMMRFNPDDFSLLIIDEAHHAVSASYRRVINHYRQNPKLKVLGVTATPDRTDDKAMGQVFEHCAYTYDIQDAVEDGWLVKPVQQQVEVHGLDLSACRTTAGDLNGKDLAEVMAIEEVLHGIADPTYRIADGRKTLAFATTVAQAERLAEIFNRYQENCARWVCGKTPKLERKDILERYANGDFHILVNVGVFTEGFDEPGVQVVAVARPTKSRSLYTQMIGRGTRPLPGTVDGLDSPEDRIAAIAASGKPNVEIIDFHGNSGRHKLICPADVLGGKYEEDVRERAKEKLSKDSEGKPADVAEALEEAKKEIEEQRRREREEAERRKHIRARAEFTKREVDPFSHRRQTQEQPHGHLPARTVATLQRAKVPEKLIAKMDEPKAKALAQTIIARYKAGLCSYKQASLLKRFGYSKAELHTMTKGEASSSIEAIKENGWKRPAATGGVS